MGHCIRFAFGGASARKGVSGLVTAIVLIAFVVVASAFSYAMMNKGFFATQQSQAVVVGGLQGASSVLVVDGPVYGYGDVPGPKGNLTTVVFWLSVVPGSDSVDLSVNKTTIGFENPRGFWPNVYNTGGGTLTYTMSSLTYTASSGACTLTWEIGSGPTLGPNEKVRVTLNLGQDYLARNDLVDAGKVQKDEQFTITIKLTVGGTLTITRTAPGAVASINDLG